MLNEPCMNKLCADKLFELTREAHTILEWGSGGSTISMLKELQKSATIYSVEHDISFYNKILPQLNNSVVYTYAPDKNSYVNNPSGDIHYSFILVDGRYRKECLERARKEMSWDILLLHDAERERYVSCMDEFGDEYNKYFIKNLWVCERQTT